MTIPLGHALLRGSSNLPACGSGDPPIQWQHAYLVLLRMRFTLPLLLPKARWALTPPFHPYLFSSPLLRFTNLRNRRRLKAGSDICPRFLLSRRFVFCGTCSQLALGGRYPPSSPVEPGLSSGDVFFVRSRLSPRRHHTLPRSHPAIWYMQGSGFGALGLGFFGVWGLVKHVTPHKRSALRGLALRMPQPVRHDSLYSRHLPRTTVLALATSTSN